MRLELQLAVQAAQFRCQCVHRGAFPMHASKHDMHAACGCAAAPGPLPPARAGKRPHVYVLGACQRIGPVPARPAGPRRQHAAHHAGHRQRQGGASGAAAPAQRRASACMRGFAYPFITSIPHIYTHTGCSSRALLSCKTVEHMQACRSSMPAAAFALWPQRASECAAFAFAREGLRP